MFLITQVNRFLIKLANTFCNVYKLKIKSTRIQIPLDY